MNVMIAAYGIPWIPLNLVKAFLKTNWDFLEYSSHKIEYEDVIKKNPLVLLAFRPPQKIIQHDSIKYLITPGAGIDHLNLEYLKERGIKLINCHANSKTVAEHGWALLLAASKNIIKYHNCVKNQSKWPDRGHIYDLNVDLSEKNIGIIGYGNVGKQIEKYAQAFGMESLIFRLNPDEGQYNYYELEDKTSDLDFLIISCPLTEKTKSLVGKNIIAALPSHCILINIARGEILDEKAAFDALENGELRALAIDTWQESGTDESASVKIADFIDIDGLTVSPHRAWVSKESYAKVAEQLAFELDLIAKNKLSENLIDFERSY